MGGGGVLLEELLQRLQREVHEEQHGDQPHERVDLPPAAEKLLTDEARAREAWLAGHLQQLTREEREVLREASVIMDKLASE